MADSTTHRPTAPAQESGNTLPLCPEHLEHLTEGSGIAPDVITERGYWSCSGHSELKSLGITVRKRDPASGILMPCWGLDGTRAGYFSPTEDREVPYTIFRPDFPQVNAKGKVQRYLNPKGTPVRLDCHPRCHDLLRDPSTFLWVTEGYKKGDKLVTEGACAIALQGVEAWRVPEWHEAYPKGRRIGIVYDSDVMQKFEVQRALASLTAYLTSKGARVQHVYLPSPEDGKMGVDDFLLTHTLADLEALLEPPRSRERMQRAAWTTRAGPGHPADPAARSCEAPLPYSDYTNALAFVQEHGAGLRYCYPWQAWLVWTGTHWQRDTNGAVMRLAKATVKRLARRVETLEDDKARALMAHIKSSLSTGKLKALIENAQSEPGIAVQPGELDADIWALNCLNGTLDLRSGTLRPHRQADMLTKCLQVAYDPEARCPQWITFLDRAMQGNAELVVFLQRALGYSLSGSTREQCFFLLHGITKTGKSTCINTARKLLGDYAKQAEASTFLHKDRTEVRNDLAMLAGARFVSAIETDKNKKLAEALVKQATGGTDSITARFLFEELFEFVPQFKVFLATNHAPKMDTQDDAIWERVHRIPFLVQIPKAERDKELDEKLERELPGILAWAVRGCMEWQRDKDLRVPDVVTTATQALRDEMDDIKAFLEECCILGDTAIYKTQATTLLQTYHRWAGNTTMSTKALNKALTDRHYESKHGNSGNFWLGIGIPAPEEDERYS